MNKWDKLLTVTIIVLALIALAAFEIFVFGRSGETVVVSVDGACAHTVMQVCVAGLLLYTYFPLLLIVSAVCGVFTSLAAKFALKRMEKK